MRHQPNCYYCTLSASPSGTTRDIRFAYFAASRLSHPDRHPATGSKKYMQLFHQVILHYLMGWWQWRADGERKVHEAYQCLSDASERKVYEIKCGFGGVRGEGWDVEHERAKRAEQKTASAQKKKERKASEAAQKKAAKERRASQDRTAKGYPKTSAEEMDKILGEIKESKARLQKMEEEGRKREAEEIREKEEEARKEKKKKQEAEELRKKVEEELMEEARKKEQEEVELLQQIAKFKRRAKVVEPTVKGEERLKKEGGEDTEEDEEEKISWQILKSRAEQRAALEARKKEAEEAMKRGAEEAKEREAKEAKKRDAEEKKSKKEAQEAQEAREVQRKWAKELHRERMRAEEEEKKRKRRPSVPEFEFSTPYLSDRTGTRQRNVRIGCPPDTSSGARWSGEEVQYMKSQRAAGLSWRDVAVAVNEKFGTGRSVSACSSKSYREP